MNDMAGGFMATKNFLAASIAMTVICGGAHAQDICSAYVGQSPTIHPFSSLETPLSKVPAAKGEFETTAAFEARKSTALSGLGATMVMEATADREYIRYDADTQKLNIFSGAFGGEIPDLTMKFIIANPGESVRTELRNSDVVISETSKNSGTYIGQNGFGAHASISKSDTYTKAIFDRPVKSTDFKFKSNYLFTQGDDEPIGYITLPAQQAQDLKRTLKLGFVTSPKAPYSVSGTYKVGDTTVTEPFDVTNHFTILFADIKCGLVMNSSGKVLAAYPTANYAAPAMGSTTLIPITSTQTIPPYPTISERLGEQGTAILNVTVEADGTVGEDTLLKSSGSDRLDQVSLVWVKASWRWQPIATPMQTTISIPWHLH